MKQWRHIVSAVGFIAVLAVALPFSIKMHKAMAGTPELERKIEEVSARLDEKIDKDRRNELQERMWQLEERWGEKFIAEKNYGHRTIGELLQFMTKEARQLYLEAQAEFEELEEKRKARARESADDQTE